MKKTIKYAFTSAVFAATVPCLSAAEKASENTKQCSEVYESTSKAIAQSPGKVLEVVSRLVAANESCAGEVVKAAITTTKADKNLVKQIVETAATAAPKQILKIGASAMAVAPDASNEIAVVLNKINAELGTAQGKAVHPLNFPEGVNNVNQGAGNGSTQPLVGPPAGSPAGAGVGGASGAQSEGASVTNTPPAASR